MGIVPLYVWTHLPSADNKNNLVARSEQPVLPEEMEERKTQLKRLKEQDTYLYERLVRLFRIFDAVYCPSSPRHTESAKLICDFFRMPMPILDDRLDAVDYGDFKGQPTSVMQAPHNYIKMPYPNGESWLDCLERWQAFFQEVLQKHDGHPVLLAGQTRASIRMCAHLCDGIDLNEAVDLDIGDNEVPWVYFYKF
jgi:broad specificity phosphatase PhoE